MALKDNLIAHWELEETSGTRVDSQGTHDLTDNNTVTSATGKVGTAGSFTASNNEYLDRASIDAELKTGDFDWTFALWLRTPSTILSAGTLSWGHTFATRSVELSLDSATLGLHLSVTDTGGTETDHTIISVASLAADTWYFVTVRFDASADELIARIDGGSNQTFAKTSVRNSATVFRLGRGRTNAYWEGLIDDTSFWNAYKSDADLDEIYNSGAGLAFADWDAAGGQISGTAAGTSTASGTLTGRGALSGSAAGTSTATGALSALGFLSGSVAGTSTASGTLTARGNISGTAAGTSTASGTLTARGGLAGVSTGQATVLGTLNARGYLSGSTAGTSTTTGTLSSGGADTLSGTAAGVSTATGTLTARGYLSGAAAGSSVVAGDIKGRAFISGAVTGTSTASGSLNGRAILQGTASGSSTATGTLLGRGLMSGSSVGSVTVTGTLTARGYLSGTSSGTSTATGSMLGGISDFQYIIHVSTGSKPTVSSLLASETASGLTATKAESSAFDYV